MSGLSVRKALTVELYDVTGEALPENDPIVTGALFFSYKLGESGRLASEEIRSAAALACNEIREAGRLAALEIREAAREAAVSSGKAITAVEVATRAAAAAVDRLAADRTQMLKSVETQVAKCVKAASAGQAGSHNAWNIPVWYAVVGSCIGAAGISAALMFGFERGSVQAQEAAVGRSFARVVPALDPKLREQIMRHLRKKGS